MSKRILTIGLSLLSSFHMLGCATEADEECLPGDIDCAAPAGGDGKADGFDYKNDPVRMSQHLTYKLADLPKKGDRTKAYWKDQYPEAVGKSAVTWADTYWPTSEGSHNNRWQGDNEKSPLEKYDAAYNAATGCATYPSKFYGTGAKAEWDTYYNCAGPAAKWQSQEFQGGGEMHDGIDNDHDGKTDDYGTDGSIDGIQGWWGTCHAWTPASMLFPEPQHAVTVDGTTFAVGDIKALLQNISDSTSAVMLGGRCNAKEIKHDVTGSANDECRDVNPGALHVILTNYLGLTNLPLVEDRTANYEVWNQPVVGYEVTKQAKITAKNAMLAVGATGSTWTYNTKAKTLYEVRMTVKYVTESSASTTPVGFKDNILTDNYHYILELDANGKIIGGRFATDSENSGIDFLWAPTGTVAPSNPYVKVAKVKELLAASVKTDVPTTTGKTFTASPAAAIPDNDPAGVSTNVAVTGVDNNASLTVSVDIKHTYRGDLVIDLLKDGVKVKTLAANTGGSAHDVIESYNVGAMTSANGTYTLKVTDTAAQDVGTVNAVTLNFQ
ncbi:MAG: proprotein convertase P-domain-containing protein [Proteobacteria bacterium]|nr:proprotein convertase P-domain-containing protein [Pseudomonadota bacterium]